MVNYCVCGGCTNSTLTGHRVHGFPMNHKATLRQWVQFVRVRREDFSMSSATKNSKICSAHFREEDYNPGDMRMVSLGLKRLSQARLIPTAVPSVHTHFSACPGPRSTDKLGAARCKRELATMLTDASPQENADSVGAAVDDPLPSSTCDTGTQCNLKPLGRSHAVQVNLKPQMVSVGTQTTFRMQTSTPLTSPEQTDEEDDPSVFSDASWVPEDQMSEEDLCEEELSQTCDPHQNGIDKFIVCKEELMALFAICPACCEKSESRIVQQAGTFIKIEQSVGSLSGTTLQLQCKPRDSTKKRWYRAILRAISTFQKRCLCSASHQIEGLIRLCYILNGGPSGELHEFTKDSSRS